MKNIIEVKNLVKKYPRITAVDNISFDVYQGEVFGLLGENGAGKTTTMEIIEGLRRPTSGNIKVLGYDVLRELNEIKEKIGLQLQFSAYYQYLKLREILNLFGSFYKKSLKAIDLLKIVDLEDKAEEYVGRLSGGQQQRFSIIASLINDPEIVFLDEPTTGLDPISRRHLWNIITKIRKQGKTIILTTHYMEEAEVLCDRVGIMDKGKIISLGNTYQLIAKANYPFKVNFVDHDINDQDVKILKKLGKLQSVAGKKYFFDLRLKNRQNLNKALDLINKKGPESLNIGSASLEDVFIELTGKNIIEE